MEIMENYADLTRKIDLIQTQIEMFEVELEYWWFTNDNSPGKGMERYGLSVASERTDKKAQKLNELRKMLEFYQEIKQDMDDAINALTGLDYRIAYMRFIEGKSYQIIADELGYTYGYVRQVASKTNKRRTAFKEKA